MLQFAGRIADDGLAAGHVCCNYSAGSDCRSISDFDAERLQREHNHASIVVTPDKPAKRRHLAETFIRAGFSLADLIHPSATISPSSHIGDGAVIQVGVIIVGAHHEIIELCELLGRKVIGVVHGPNPVDLPGYPTLGYDRDAERLQREHNHASIVVTPDKPAKRRHLAETFIRAGFSLADLIHPSATISPSSHIGDGAVIQVGVNISAATNIGLCVKL